MGQGVIHSNLRMIFSPGVRCLHGGTLVMTQGINDWISTGLAPYETEPHPQCLGIEFRRHHIAVALSAHLNCDQLDTCSADHELNLHVYNRPGCGGRLVSSIDRNHCPPLFIITDDWGGPDAVTTVLFRTEY